MWRNLKIQFMTQYGLFAIFAIFVVVQLLFIWNGGEYKIFESPDANINYHFSARLARGLPLAISTPVRDDIAYVTPRSAVVRAGMIVPSGFTGLIIIYGFLSAITVPALIPYWLLLFAVVGLLHFYWLLKRLFSPAVAWWSMALIMMHPAWAYYTQRSLLPNVLFVSLIMMSVYYFFQISQRQRWSDHLLGGLTLAAALAVRPSEIVWVAPALIIFTLMQRRRLFSRNIILALVGAMFIIILVAVALIGHYDLIWGSGYQLVKSVSSWRTWWQSLFLPFGFHPRLIWWVLINYVIVWPLPFTLLAVIGILTYRNNFREMKHRRYVWLLGFVSIVLLCYYGSWVVQDNTLPNAVTIGTSYVRYLLPIYVFSAPLAAWAIINFARQMLPSCRRWFLAFISVCLMLFSLQTVVLAPVEGWLATRANLEIYQRTLERTKEVLPDESIIMTLRSDKYIWPTFSVITPQGDNGYLQATGDLLQRGYRVYFLNPTITPDRRDYLNQAWVEYNFSLGDPLFESEGLGLYNLVSSAKP